MPALPTPEEQLLSDYLEMIQDEKAGQGKAAAQTAAAAQLRDAVASYCGAAGAPAGSLMTTGAAVDVRAAAPPAAGQVLSASDPTHATWKTPVPPVVDEDIITCLLDGAGGSKAHVEVQWACTIIGWTLLADVVGDISVDVLLAPYAAWPQTSTICAGVFPALAAAQKAQSFAGGCVGAALASGDILEFFVAGVPTVAKAWLSLRVRRT